VASVVMLHKGFVHPCVNCEDLHPEIEAYADAIPHEGREMPDMRILVKASFGFGDVNACLVFSKWEGN
jgi:3-oxoacyl-(acyl-carrier-protein) synthase